MTHPIKELVKLQKRGIPVGIFSVCSANEYVIEASMRRALDLNTHVLIEATANQVNQEGGYTGMTPKDFTEYVRKIALRVEFPMNRLILGGDHLGPLVWKDLPIEEAMRKSECLVEAFVMAGFTKIHVDTSMELKGDFILDESTIASRGARLALACERAYTLLKEENKQAIRPVYVIGSEVPTPGGALEEEVVRVTHPDELENTIEAFKDAFIQHGIEGAWEQVVAVVVQPGVEFSDSEILEYDRLKARALTDRLKSYPNLILEGHSTDYQTPKKLKEMVEDGIGILKVGPGLTFSLREALFALENIEKEICIKNRSDLSFNLEQVMKENPHNWANHYHGDEETLRLKRRYSFSDRARYYFGHKAIDTSIEKLLSNLSRQEIPLTLLSQYAPIQYQKVRKGLIKNHPYELLLDGVVHNLDEYYFAVMPDAIGMIKSNFG